MDFPMWEFLKDVTIRVTLVTLLALILPCISYKFIDVTVIRLFVVCIVSILSSITMGYYFGFNKNERINLKNKVFNTINKKILHNH